MAPHLPIKSMMKGLSIKLAFGDCVCLLPENLCCSGEVEEIKITSLVDLDKDLSDKSKEWKVLGMETAE